MDELFDFKINSNKVVTVITFQGKITKDNMDQLQRCRGDLGSLHSKLFVIYFKDVVGIEQITYRELTLIQQEIRKKSSLLCIVGLNHELKSTLTLKAIVRPSELKRNLEEAIKAA